MEKMLKVAKYQLRDLRSSIFIYYLAIISIGLLFITVAIRNQPSGETHFGGATSIFIFIVGLNCFKGSFKFMQANNVSRKSFHLGTIIAIISISAIMSIVDIAIDHVLSQYITTSGMFDQTYRVYTGNWFLSKGLWNLALYTFATSAGYLITMIYYRANTLMKVVTSIIPIVVIMLFTYASRLTNGSFVLSIQKFLVMALGLGGSQNPFAAVVTFSIGSIIILSIGYLLIFRAPIKE
ncbi:hypothetical protein [Alkaliphilus transvaalensis]|uniref:hypothetical protein n=1 Tax=Alkaliphilus transvaalensis TaxID=114628 RepID=UPI00047AE4A1|nr:hypothetical protein [Alkaliphilus transvaalensis]